MKKNSVNSKLLAKYFSGQATLLEQAEIEQWLKMDNNFEIYFEELVAWETSNLQYLSDTKEGLKNFQRKVSTIDAEGNQKMNSSFRSYTKWILLVACVSLLITIGVLFSDKILFRTITTTYAETQTIELADNSRVTLNANSSIRIPRFLEWYENREVWITGEAFFMIQKKTDRQKFIVHTNHVDVEVLGTRFNVNARTLKTRVVLETGSVRVKSNQDDHSTLAYLKETGDFVESDGLESGVITGQVDHSLFTAWQERKLKFENAPLTEVLRMIDDFYGVSIQCKDPSILEKHFSGTLPNDNLDIVLKSLSNIYNSSFLPIEAKNK